MKTIMTSVFLMLMSISIYANIPSTPIQLPDYTVGKHESTIIDSYFGPIGSGKGRITINSPLLDQFVTGVKFYLVVDSIPPGTFPSRDSAGVFIPLHKGDKIPLPIVFIAERLGLRVIAEGIPSISNESYLCDLDYAFTLGEDWEMYIFAATQKKCTVGIISGIHGTEAPNNFNLYPNPSLDKITVDLNSDQGMIPYCIIDKLGREVQNGLLTSPSTEVFIHSLSQGMYLIQIGSERRQTIKLIKQ